MLKQHTSRFEDTIFAINYLCTEQTDVHVFEIKRTIKKMQKYEKMQITLGDIARFYNMSGITYYEKIFTPTSVIQKYERLLAYYKIHNMQLQQNIAMCKIEFGSCIFKYIKYLHSTLHCTKQNSSNIHTLENKTSYFYKDSIIMTYNKATYCDEVDNLKLSNSDDYYIYLFGYGIDTIEQNCQVALCTSDNISTEICKDLSSNVKQSCVDFKHIHIIQSDWIDIIKYKSNLPNCDIVINADTHYPHVYKKYNSILHVQNSIMNYHLELQKNICLLNAFLIA